MNEERQNSEGRNERQEVGAGIAFTVALHIIFAAILTVVFLLLGDGKPSAFTPLLFLGFTQGVYMIPAFVIARGKGKEQLAKGLLIGAGITLLLNTACAGYLLWDAGIL
jgi:hypothetical protein